MAFVFRTIDKENDPKLETPGPGTYFYRRKYIQQQDNQARAPFNNTSNREIWKSNNIPGPGTYQSQSGIKKQKKLMSDIMGQIVVYQTPKQSAPFISKTMRFTQNQNTIKPGPGEYEVQINQKKPSSASKIQNYSSNQLKDFLRQKNKNFRQFFQNQQIQKEMIISANDNGNQYKIDNLQEELNQQQPTKKGSKNSIFFSSKVQRQFIKVRPQTSAGPGTYNIDKSSFQIQKNQNKKKPTKSICLDKRIQKVQIQEVGPGYYQVDEAYKHLNKNLSKKKKKLQCFGSTVDRFQILKKDMQTTSPGPDAYQVLNKAHHKQKNQKLARNTFGKEERKIFNVRSNNITSPVSYKTQNDFSPLLKQKCKPKSFIKGSFGSTQQRFHQNNNKINFQQTDEIISKKQQILVLSNKANQNEQIKQNRKKDAVTFKTLLRMKKRANNFVSIDNSVNLKKMKQDQISLRPLAYDNQFHTLQYKYAKKTQMQAPFMSGAQRFKQNTIISTQIQKNSQKSQIKNLNKVSKYRKNDLKSKIKGLVICSDSRFKYSEQKNKDLGPQYYNPSIIQKKSYNVLFS